MRMMSAIVKRQSVFICDLERGKGERGTELIVLSTLCVDGAPRRRKPFVEPDLFPDLESFLAAERAPLDQAVDAAVGVAVCVADVVESVGTFRTGEEKVEWELADVCSRWTSSSRSKFSVMVRDRCNPTPPESGGSDVCFTLETNNDDIGSRLLHQVTLQVRTKASSFPLDYQAFSLATRNPYIPRLATLEWLFSPPSNAQLASLHDRPPRPVRMV